MGNAIRKSILVTFLTGMLIGGFTLARTLNFCTVQAATSVSGIIFSDTTWTKADSPYNITGPTAIAKGVTLTIEPGVVVHFNTNTLEVNGTLRAIGTSTEPITLNGDYRGRLGYFGSSDHNGILTFTSESNGWNSQTGTGCIIENVNVISLSIYIHNVSVNLNNNVFSGSYAYGGISVDGGDSLVSNNRIIGGSIFVDGGSPFVYNNTLIGRSISVTGGSPTILNNLLYSGYSGLTVSGVGEVGNVKIADNIIANGTGFKANEGNVTFEHNLVLYNSGGCSFGQQVNLIVKYNTIAFNGFGIEAPPASATVRYNNLENNNQKNFIWSLSSNFDAAYNWWGTTDSSAISQTIVDYKNNYNLGNVTFIPFLDAPNPQAPLISSFVEPSSPSPSPSPTATPSPATTPTPTPKPSEEPQQTLQFEAIVGAAIVAAVIGAGLGLLIYLIKRK